MKAADDGWVNLFNGKNLDGWVQHGGKAKYRVEGNQIVGTTVPNTTNSFLCTKKNYANFILEADVKFDVHGNSGIQVRSHVTPQGRVFGYQCEIDPSERAWSGGIRQRARCVLRTVSGPGRKGRDGTHILA